MPPIQNQPIDEIIHRLLNQNARSLTFEELMQAIELETGTAVRSLEVREAAWRLIATGRAILTSQRTISPIIFYET